jgi:hypothetical protein
MSTTPQPSALDRILLALRQLVSSELEPLKWYGTYEYSVTGSAPCTIDAVPTDPTTGLPPLSRVPLVSSLLGQTSTPAPTGLAHVRFVNGDPARPRVTALTATAQQATIDASSSMTLGASAGSIVLNGGTKPAALVGSYVTFFLPPNMPITGTLSGVPFSNVVTITNAFNGIIATGAQHVTGE